MTTSRMSRPWRRRSLAALAVGAVGLTGSAVISAGAASAAPVPQAPVAAAPPPTPFDLMLVIDGSGSIDPNDFDLARSFAKRMLASCLFVPGSQAGAIQFSSQGDTQLLSGLTKQRSIVEQALDQMEQLQGSTDIQEGLDTAQTQLAAGRTGAKKFIVLLTDGQQTEAGDPVASATAAKTAGSEIFTIGVGTGTDQTELDAIASPPANGHNFPVTDFASLESSLAAVTGAACGTAPVDLGKYQPLNPTRVLDTRSGLGAPQAKVGVNQTLQVQVGGQGGVPADAEAVLLNATVADPDTDGFLTVWPCGSAVPTVSNLNFSKGRDRANLVSVRLGVDGKVCMLPGASAAHLVADVAGYFGSTGTLYNAVQPFRALDTRNGTGGVPAAAVGVNAVVELKVAGVNGVPADAAAVVLNATATEPSAKGFLTVWPCGSPRPTASNLNFSAGENVPGLTAVKLGTDGKVCFSPGAASSHVIADVMGWFGATGGEYNSLFPLRVVDTRSDQGNEPLTANGQTELQFIDSSGGLGGIPPNTSAVVLNVTVTNPASPGFLTVWPCGTPRPTASNLNFTAGQTVANLVTVKLGQDSKVCFSAISDTDAIVDLVGYVA